MLTAMASILAYQVSPEAAAVGLMAAVNTIRSGLRGRAQSRESALTQTVEWAEKRKSIPVLSESYRYYKLQLQKTSQGTKPLAFGRFVERLTLHDFMPANPAAKD